MTIDLTTQFGSLVLRSPIVIGACPMTAHDLTRIALISSGAGAIVLPSFFEDGHWNQSAGFETCDRSAVDQNEGDQISDADSYLNLVEQASASGSIPVIASINGDYGLPWVEFVRQLEAAGASAIEFNIRRRQPTQYLEPREVEDRIVESTERLSEAISIPLFLKLGRHYTCLSHLIRRLLSSTDGVVLFGYAPEVDISLDSLKAETRWGLTETGSIALSIESIMRVHNYCPEMPLAASGGIGSCQDVARALLAGADVAMVTSAVYRDGPDVIASWLDGLKLFMERHHMKTLSDLRARRPACLRDDEDRDGYIRALSTPPAPHVIRSANRTLECDRWGHIQTRG